MLLPPAGDDPSKWIPNVGLLGAFAQDKDTDHMTTPAATVAAPVEELWPVLNPDTGDPHDWIAAWRETVEDMPIFRAMIEEMTFLNEEKEAA